MRDFIFLLLLFISSFGVKGQSTEDIENHLSEYFICISNKDYDKLYEVLSPSWKKYLNKDQMERILSIAESDEYVFQMVNFEITFFSDPVLYDDVFYIKIDYNATRNLIYQPVASAEFIEKANNVFYKTGPLSFEYIEAEKKLITVSSVSIIMCIDIANEEDIVYSFMPYRPKLLPYLHLLVPQEVVDELFKS